MEDAQFLPSLRTAEGTMALYAAHGSPAAVVKVPLDLASHLEKLHEGDTMTLVSLSDGMAYQATAVKSSNIAAIGSRPEYGMCVVFRNGGVYVYRDVQSETVQKVLHGESVGRGFDQLVKKAGFEAEKVWPHPEQVG